MCQRNLGRIGEAVSAYVADNGNYLPGPIHIAFPYDAGEVFQSAGGQGEAWYKLQPAAYLNPYVRGRADDSRSVDTLAYCPTADSIPVASSEGQPWFHQPRLYYVANTGSVGVYETPGVTPYYATVPVNYFGRIDRGSDPAQLEPWDLPKQIDTIPNVSREWAVADLWYWAAKPNPRASVRQVGTWPYIVGDTTSLSVANEGELKIPSYPFHNTRKTFSPDDADVSPTSPRLTTGVTNALFFDAHVEGVRGWTGSVNPRFAEAGTVEGN
jgi:prepilin-type processing-associated H-X9-DG protein